MEITNSSLKEWIDTEKERFPWLVERTKISRSTMYNYCSKRTISAPNKVLLAYAIDEYERMHACGLNEVSADDQALIRRLAEHAKASIDAMVMHVLPAPLKVHESSTPIEEESPFSSIQIIEPPREGIFA